MRSIMGSVHAVLSADGEGQREPVESGNTIRMELTKLGVGERKRKRRGKRKIKRVLFKIGRGGGGMERRKKR